MTNAPSQRKLNKINEQIKSHGKGKRKKWKPRTSTMLQID